MEDVNKLLLSMVIPAIKTFINQFDNIDNDKLNKLCWITEVGCLKVDYYNKKTEKQDTIHILLKECDKDHNLTNELDKLKQHLDDDKWNEILKQLSSLILLTRSIYSYTMQQLNQSEGSSKYDDILSVDMDNTTLYIKNYNNRIGIFLE
jgi:hypothetical protein